MAVHAHTTAAHGHSLDVQFRAHLALGAPDIERLKQAEHHARLATRLNGVSPDAWRTLALIKHRLGETIDALAVARRAVDLDPKNPLKYAHGVFRVRLGQASALDVLQSLNGERPVDTTLEKPIFLTYQRRIPEAARTCGDILKNAPPGSSGWLIPVEPVLNVSAHRGAWEPMLAILRARAM